LRHLAADLTGRHMRIAVVTTRVLVLAGFVLLLEALTQSGSIDQTIMPPPSELPDSVWSTIQTTQFTDDLVRTLSEVGMSVAIGAAVGIVLGVLSWRVRLFGEAVEPYLVTLYAVPTLVFYPILLAIMGLGSGPIVAITSVMVAVPVALNTMVGLRDVAPTLLKLARSVHCTRRQMYWKVLFPAATPLVMAGLKLGVMYGIIGTIAMEFMLADRGLGFRIGNDYLNFAMLDMWTNIVVVVVLATVIVWLLGVVERRVRRDMV
jgi:NitT/TauT family transport system permease protein